jgi:uncharacterized protein
VTLPGAAPERDRDTAGRPKNARPRDGLGRPLPRGAAGEPVMPEDLELTPAEAVQLAQHLIDEGRPFHAHEVLEATWKSAPADERALWKGLAQIAVGLTHARRGNSKGAVTLLRRGAAAVAGYTRGPATGRGDHALLATGLDLDAILAASAGLADLIAVRGLDAVPPSDLRIPLSG